MAAPARKQRGRPFRPGQSGNPAGTSKTPPEVRAFLTEHSMTAAEALVRVLRSKKTEAKVVVAAAKTILEFSVARPKEQAAAGEAAQQVIAALAAVLTAPRALPPASPEPDSLEAG